MPIDRSIHIPIWVRATAGALMVGLVLRVAYLTQIAAHPILADARMLDAVVFDEFAKQVLAGDFVIGDRAYTLAPLYPYLLALVRAVAGESNVTLFGLQQLSGLASIALAAWLAHRIAGGVAAVATAAMLVLYAPLALMETKLMASSCAVFLSTATLALMVHASDARWRARFVWVGALLGLACLARPNILLFCPLAFAWLLWREASNESEAQDGGRGTSEFESCGWGVGRSLPAVFLTLGVLIVVLPVSLRNTLLEGEFILISSQSGVTFWQGNNPQATGGFTVLKGLTGDPARDSDQVVVLASAALGHSVTQSEANDYMVGQALSFYREHPARGVMLVLKKLRYWIGNQELSTEYVLITERRMMTVLWLLPIPFGLIFACSLLSLRRESQRSPAEWLLWAFAASNLVTVLIFYFSSRYRLPAVPAVAILAGVGVARLRESLARQSAPSFVAAGAAALVFAAAGVPQGDGLAVQDAANRFNLGVLYQEAGYLEEARDEYLASLEIHEMRWDSHHNLGLAYLRLGRPREAISHLSRAVDLNPGASESREIRDAIRARLEAFESGSILPTP